MMEKTRYPNPYVPVFKLQGTPYEIGFQHGHQPKRYIDSNIKTYATWFQENAGLSWAEAAQRATTFGIADGAHLTRDEILALNIRSEIGLMNYGEEPPAISDGCTGLAQLSSDGSKTILAQNWDWLEGLENGMIIVDITTNAGTRMQFLDEAGLVGKIGLNSHGFGLCNNAMKCGVKTTDRLPTHIMSRRFLEYAESFTEAVELLEAYSGACTTNYVLADAKGKFSTVEVSPRGISIISSGNGQGSGFVAHTNHMVSPLEKFPHGPIYDHPAPNSFAWLARISNLTKNDVRDGVPTTAEAVTERLKDRQGAPYGICRDVPVDAMGPDRMKTLASIVMEYDNVRGTARGMVTICKPCVEGLQRVDWVF